MLPIQATIPQRITSPPGAIEQETPPDSRSNTELQIQKALSHVKDGATALAEQIYSGLKNQADFLKIIGDKEGHDQIYYQLLETAIQFQIQYTNENGDHAAYAIFGLLRLSETHYDSLNVEASLRFYMCNHPQFILESSRDYFPQLTNAAATLGRPWASYQIGTLFENGMIKSYCGPTPRDMPYERQLLQSRNYAAIDGYTKKNFISDPKSELNAAICYCNALSNPQSDASTLAKQGLIRLTQTTQCPQTLLKLSEAIDCYQIDGLTKNYGKVLSERAAIISRRKAASTLVENNISFFEGAIKNKNEFISLYFDHGLLPILKSYSEQLLAILHADKRLITIPTAKKSLPGRAAPESATMLQMWKERNFDFVISNNNQLAQFLVTNADHDAIALWNTRRTWTARTYTINRDAGEDIYMYPREIDGKINKFHENEQFKTEY